MKRIEVLLRIKKVLLVLVAIVSLFATIVCCVGMVACAINSWQMHSVNATQTGMQFWGLIAIFSLLAAVTADRAEKISIKIGRLEC